MNVENRPLPCSVAARRKRLHSIGVSVTDTTPEKPGCWILHDPGDDAPNSGGVTGDDPNWGGPMPRHDKRSAVLFIDGHVVSLKPSIWYWSLSPWLKPDVGGS